MDEKQSLPPSNMTHTKEQTERKGYNERTTILNSRKITGVQDIPSENKKIL
jgi:hypothetical protein